MITPTEVSLALRKSGFKAAPRGRSMSSGYITLANLNGFVQVTWLSGYESIRKTNLKLVFDALSIAGFKVELNDSEVRVF